jgi:hypothetical protein
MSRVGHRRYDSKITRVLSDLRAASIARTDNATGRLSGAEHSGAGAVPDFLRVLGFGRQHFRADGTRAGLARHDRAAGPGAHASRAPRHLQGDHEQGRRPGALATMHISGIESWLRTALAD